MGFWRRLKEYFEKKNKNSTVLESNPVENIGSFKDSSNSDYSDTVMSKKNNGDVGSETIKAENSPSNTNISNTNNSTENNDSKGNNNTETEKSPNDNIIKTDNNSSHKNVSSEKNNDKDSKEEVKAQNSPEKTKEEDIPEWKKDIQKTRKYLHTSGEYLEKVLNALDDIKKDLEEIKKNETDEKVKKDIDKLIDLIKSAEGMYGYGLTTLLLTTYRAIKNEMRFRKQDEELKQLKKKLKELEEKFRLLNNIQQNRFEKVERAIQELKGDYDYIGSKLSNLEWETNQVKTDTERLKIRTRGF